jgi:hypothetical protein
VKMGVEFWEGKVEMQAMGYEPIVRGIAGGKVGRLYVLNLWAFLKKIKRMTCMPIEAAFCNSYPQAHGSKLAAHSSYLTTSSATLSTPPFPA